MSIPLPRLLDKTFHEVRRLNPTKVSINMTMQPLSTATMTLPPGEVTVSAGDFVELFTPNRTAGIFRVSKAATDYITGKQTLTLEHGIVTMADAVVYGKHQFFGYDEGGGEDVTITGYVSTMNRVHHSGQSSPSRYASISWKNSDGSSGSVYFDNTTAIVPIVTKSASGWVTVINQSVIDQASRMTGTWDGVVRSAYLASDLGKQCITYSNATGVMLETSHLRDNTGINGTVVNNRTIAAGAAVNVLAECEEVWLVVETSSGSRGYVRKTSVQLDPGYIIVDPSSTENQFETVANAMIAQAHNQKTNWEFGESDFSESYGYTFNNVNLLDAILSLPEKLSEKYLWEFDQTTSPWRINLRRMDDQGIAELRTSRNLSAVQISVDMSDVVTCVCPIGANGLTVESVNDGDKFIVDVGNEELYGHVEKIVTSDDNTAQKLYETGLRELAEHGEPTVCVTLSALDLSAMTGEPLDALWIGKTCRVPIPDKGITVVDYITKLSWSDVYGAPTKVAVTLANSPKTASGLIAQLMRGG